MFGVEYRWLRLHPLVRGCFLSLGVAALAVLCLLARPALTSAAGASALVVATAKAETEAKDRSAAWPRAVLRLWLLAPQLLPAHDR